MQSKVRKLLFIAIVMFSILFISKFTYARSVNTIEELGKIIDEKQPDAETAFVIGKYVFTSKHTITTEDIMLAARSIDVEDKEGKTNEDGIYKEMTISRLEKIYDETTFAPKGWRVVETNAAGETKLFDEGKKPDIKYVDYNYVKDLYTVTLDTDEGDPEYQESITVEEGGKINPELITGNNRPTKANKQFKEWVWTKDGEGPEVAWNFETDTVNGPITLKATWLDEVNTDKLLEDAEDRMKENEWYSVKFNATTSKLTFTVLDKNEKNSLISGTGITGNIVQILKETNVESITMGTTKFTKTDLSTGGGNPAGPTGDVWKKFGEELASLTHKDNFSEVTLGDLVGVDLKLTITVDKEKALSQNGNESEEYTIEFVYNAQASIDETIPESEEKELKDTFNYTPDDTYKITGENGYYSIVEGGYVTEKDGIIGFGDSTTGFYFAYTITLDEGVDPSSVKVKIPKKPNETVDTGAYKPLEESDYNIVDNLTSNQLTVLMEVEKDEKIKYRDIIVEVDGVPSKIRIDFSKLELRKNSKFTIEALDDGYEEGSNWNGWTEKDGYKTHFSIVDDNPTMMKVKGTLPIFNDEFTGGEFKDSREVYYIGFVVKTELNTEAEDDGTINVKFLQNNEETISKEDFGNQKELYVLKHIKVSNIDGSALEKEKRNFKVTLDWDGTDKTEYNSYTITVDWSELALQNDSSGSDYEIINSLENLRQEEQDELEGYGFKNELNNVSYHMNNSQPDIGEYKDGLQGTVKEQKLEKGFKDNKGYFLPIKIEFPDYEVLENYKRSWTLTLNVEGGGTKLYTPKDEEYDAGYVMVLFRITEGQEEIKYTMDFDGPENKAQNTGYDFTPFEEKINISNLTFLQSHEVSFNGTGDTITVWDGDKITEDMIPEIEQPTADDDYHKFAYWNKEDGTKFDEVKITKDSGDIALVPHWNLNSDKFVSDVIEDLKSEDTTHSGNFKDKFDLIVDENDKSKITIEVKNPETLLSEMNDTSIPGAIAYALNKDEIQEISLQVVDESEDYIKTFDKNGVKTISGISMVSEVPQEVKDLKEKVQAGAKALYEEVLTAKGKEEENMTLSGMATSENPSFKLIIGTTDETVTLVSGEDNKDAIKEYTFTFKSDVLTVKDETQLKNALSQPNVKTIYIGEDFSVNASVEVSKEGVEIIGGTHTLTASNGTSIFTVKSGKVTIDDLTLSTSKEGIVIEDGGELTSTKLNVTACTEAGITVKVGGSFTGSDLTRENEKYDNPLVRAEKALDGKTATVNVTRGDSTKATLTTVEEVKKYSKTEENSKLIYIGDTKQVKSEYNYDHYFLNGDVANRWLKITYSGNRGLTGLPKHYTMYYDKETKLTYLPEPAEDIKFLTSYEDGMATYTISKWFGNNTTYEKGQITVPDTDMQYTAELSPVYKNHVKEVTDENGLKEALNNNAYSYIVVKNEIDLQEKLDVNRKVTITGCASGEKEIKGILKGEIEVTANDVVFEEIKIVGETTTGSSKHVVTVKNTGFRSSQSQYRVESEDFDSILYYEVENPTTTLFFNSFSTTATTTYVEFSQNVNGMETVDGKEVGTSLVGNVFEDKGQEVTFIKVKGIKDNTRLGITQTDIQVTNDNTVFLSLNAQSKENPATVHISNLWYSDKKTDPKKGKIVINNTDQEDASGITLSISSEASAKIEISYSNPETSEDKQVNTSGSGAAKIKGFKLTSAEGFALSDGKITGEISNKDSSENNFTINISSANFEANKTTIKVTNPNEQETAYKYDATKNLVKQDNIEAGVTATVSNISGNTVVDLKLDAVKKDNIKSGNKIYKIAVDIDGENEDEIDEQEFTIDYEGIKIAEETINQAAKNTAKANNITIVKNNSINGYKEDFKYQYDNEKGLTYHESKDGKEIEYSFSKKYLDEKDTSKDSVVVHKKRDQDREGTAYLNDWGFGFTLQVGRAIQELSMLTDVMEESKTIIAIERVKKVEGEEHAYEVTLSREKYNEWIKGTYLYNESYSEPLDEDEYVAVKVTLDNEEKFLTSIKTIREDNNSNIFDVKFSDINATVIKEPKQFLSAGNRDVTDEELKDFYERGIRSWEKHTGAEVYKGY